MTALTLRRRPRARPLLGSWSLAIGVAGLALFVLAALAAPLVAPYDPVALDLAATLQPPSAAHWFGTDHLGRDLLSRVIWAARIDLQIGFVGVAVPLVIGSLVGLFAGYLGGWTDAAIGRVVDVVIAFPFLVLVIAIVAMLGPGLVNLYIAISAVSWVLYARIVRGETLAIRQREYVMAAESLGFAPLRIMLRHVLPNVLGPVMVLATIQVATAIITEATLSFLGVGVPPTSPSLGTLISIGNQYLFSGEWWITVFPGAMLVLIALSVNLLGDWLRDALNPRLR